jgi:hypothetical protein
MMDTPRARPKRIQRKRTKGWKIPEGAIYVGWPSVWGNPFNVTDKVPLALSLELFADLVRGFFSPAKLDHLTDAEFRAVSDARQKWIRRHGAAGARWEAQTFLRGHDLACWCQLDQPCHADVLLEIANA